MTRRQKHLVQTIGCILGYVVLSAASIIAASNGSFDWKLAGVLMVAFGLMSVVQVVQVLVAWKSCDKDS